MTNPFELLLVLFFAMTAFKDLSQKSWFYIVRGIVCLFIAALIILGHAEF